jgi:hypothetical protein
MLFLKSPKYHKANFLETRPYKTLRMNKLGERYLKCELKYSIASRFYMESVEVSYAAGVVFTVATYDYVTSFRAGKSSFDYLYRDSSYIQIRMSTSQF